MKRAIALMYQLMMAFYSPLPAILALKMGMGATFVGLLAALNSITQQAGNLFWPRYVTRTQRAGVVSLGFFGIMLGAILLANPATLIPAVIVMALLPRGTYFYLLDEVRREEGDLKGKVAGFYRINTYGTLSGMALGALASQFLPASSLPFVLLAIAGVLSAMLSSLMGEEGLMPIFRRGLVELREINRSVNGISLGAGVRHVAGARGFAHYLSTSWLFSLGFAFIYPQFPVFVDFLFGNPSLYYVLAVISRVSSIAGYTLAGRAGRSLLLGWGLRALMYGLLFASLKYPLLIFPAFVLSGFGWAFLNTFYEAENLSVGYRLTSLNHFSRGIAYSTGSAFSGYLFSRGPLAALSASLAVVLLAPLPFVLGKKYILKKEQDNNDGGPVAQSVRAPVL